MEQTPITHERIDELLAFFPAFSVSGRATKGTWHGVGPVNGSESCRMPHVSYPP
jgi:hypothetical protein